MINPKKLSHSFDYAIRGIVGVWREEQNFRVHVGIAAIVLASGYFLGLSSTEWSVVFLAVALVLVLELLNSAVERIIDLLKPRLHHYVADIKDITAGMVLVASVGSVMVGLAIFMPHLVELFSR